MISVRQRIILFLSLFLLSFFLSFYFFRFVIHRTKAVSKIVTDVTGVTEVTGVTVPSIFSSDHTFLSQIPPDHLRTLITTGDVIPARSVNSQTVRRNNFLWPWEKTADFLKHADITFINLETPLIKNCPATDSGMIFCGDTRHIEGLKYAGVDIVNLANNHSGNYGQKGVEETVTLLNSAGILTTGIPNDSSASGLTVINIKGLRFGFLGFHELEHTSDYISWKEKIIGDVQSAKKNADVLVVAFHWGWEYTDKPNKRQIELAHLAIDNGADLIAGNHPHWIQPVELYKDKLIVYAHGNFIFDQMWSEKTKEGIVGKFTFYDSQLIDAQLFPVYIKDFGQPELSELKARP